MTGSYLYALALALSGTGGEPDPPPLAVGDTVPLSSGPFDRAAWRYQVAIQRLARKTERDGTNPNTAAGKLTAKIARERAENRARAVDPIESVKTFLRLKGYKPVYERGIVLGYPATGYQVGRLILVDLDALFGFARAMGWRA